MTRFKERTGRGLQLYQIRQAKGWTLKQVEENTGIDGGHLANMEKKHTISDKVFNRMVEKYEAAGVEIPEFPQETNEQEHTIVSDEEQPETIEVPQEQEPIANPTP